MKLAIYDKDGKYVTVLEGIKSPFFVGENLVYENGTITDLSDQFVLLDDSDDIPALLIDAKPLDKMATLPVEKSQQQLDEEKDKRITDLENALLAVLDLLP